MSTLTRTSRISQVAETHDSDLTAAVDETAIVRAARFRIRGEIAVPDRRSGLLTGGSFVVAILAWLVVDPPGGIPAVPLLACIAAHAIASSIEFEIGPGSALPTTPVLVVALFLLPPQLVPIVAATGLIVAAQVARLRDPARRERLAVLAGSAWHAIGPAAVFAVARVSAPDLGQWPILALALGAQFALDAASTWVRNGYGLGVPARRLARALRFTFLADLLLAPIGLAAAIAAPGSAAALLYLLPLIALLGLLQRDRRQHINTALTLGDAVVEASDRARHDVLTGLPNRLAWEEAIARCAGATMPLAVVFADVDGLKAANDRFGHQTGDALLIAVANVVANAASACDEALAARLGGDEFGILLAGDQALRAPEVAGTLQTMLGLAPPIGGAIAVSASIGVGTAVRGADLPDAIVDADRAVYEDKRGRGVSRG